jgi:hypothetical protein
MAGGGGGWQRGCGINGRRLTSTSLARSRRVGASVGCDDSCVVGANFFNFDWVIVGSETGIVV